MLSVIFGFNRIPSLQRAKQILDADTTLNGRRLNEEAKWFVFGEHLMVHADKETYWYIRNVFHLHEVPHCAVVL